MIDQLSDRDYKMLYQLNRDMPDALSRVKSAEIAPQGTLPSTAYADPIGGLFPFHTPQHAALSHMYATRQRADASVLKKLANALECYDLNPSDFDATPRQTKEASAEEHSLLPHKTASADPRDYALRSAADVESAAYAVNMRRNLLDHRQLTDMSMRLVKAAAAYDVELPSLLHKYAGDARCDAGVLLETIEARAMACPDLSGRQTFDKLAAHIIDTFPRTGIIDDTAELIKIAGKLEELDQAFGLTDRYKRDLPDPVISVFNLEKTAELSCNLGDATVACSKLREIPDDILDEFIGEGAMASVANDDEALKNMIETLPADVKKAMYTSLRSYL